MKNHTVGTARKIQVTDKIYTKQHTS